MVNMTRRRLQAFLLAAIGLSLVTFGSARQLPLTRGTTLLFLISSRRGSRILDSGSDLYRTVLEYPLVIVKTALHACIGIVNAAAIEGSGKPGLDLSLRLHGQHKSLGGVFYHLNVVR